MYDITMLNKNSLNSYTRQHHWGRPIRAAYKQLHSTTHSKLE